MAMAEFDDYSTAAKLQSNLMMASKKSTEEKAQRVAMLKRRFADTISKAENALVHDAQIRAKKQQPCFTASIAGAVVQSASTTKTKEACEKRADDAGFRNRTTYRKKRVRKAVEISVDEAKSLEKGADRKTQKVAKQVAVVRAEKVEKGIDRKMQREAARAALDRIERTVFIDENLGIMQHIEALDRFSRQQPNLLQELGLFLKA